MQLPPLLLLRAPLRFPTLSSETVDLLALPQSRNLLEVIISLLLLLIVTTKLRSMSLNEMRNVATIGTVSHRLTMAMMMTIAMNL